MKIKIFPSTVKRVPLHTDPCVNDKIRLGTIQKLIEYDDYNKRTKTARIAELNAEWDTERVLETNAAILAIAGTILGFKRNKAWFLLPGIVGFYLLQHALTGWCPPLPMIRKLGIRTAEEIFNEKMVLKIMRRDIPKNNGDVTHMLHSVETP